MVLWVSEEAHSDYKNLDLLFTPALDADIHTAENAAWKGVKNHESVTGKPATSGIGRVVRSEYALLCCTTKGLESMKQIFLSRWK